VRIQDTANTSRRGYISWLQATESWFSVIIDAYPRINVIVTLFGPNELEYIINYSAMLYLPLHMTWYLDMEIGIRQTPRTDRTTLHAHVHLYDSSSRIFEDVYYIYGIVCHLDALVYDPECY
jgi:hypothetical protein